MIPFDLFGVARSVNADAGAIEATTTTSTPPSTVPTTTSPEAPTTSGTSGPQTSPTTVATPTTAGSGPSSTTAPRSADQRDDEQEESAAAPSTSTTGRADASPTLGGLESSGQSARIDSSSIDPLGAPADAPPAGTSEAASAAEVADESGTETTDAGAVEQAAEAPGSLALVSPPDDRAPGKSRRIGLAVGGLALMAVVASAVRSIAAHR